MSVHARPVIDGAASLTNRALTGPRDDRPPCSDSPALLELSRVKSPGSCPSAARFASPQRRFFFRLDNDPLADVLRRTRLSAL